MWLASLFVAAVAYLSKASGWQQLAASREEESYSSAVRKPVKMSMKMKAEMA